jgi:hypothetical protein
VDSFTFSYVDDVRTSQEAHAFTFTLLLYLVPDTVKEEWFIYRIINAVQAMKDKKIGFPKFRCVLHSKRNRI